MNVTNIIIAVVVGILFYFLAVFVIGLTGIAIPSIVIVLVSILVGFFVYKNGVTF